MISPSHLLKYLETLLGFDMKLNFAIIAYVL